MNKTIVEMLAERDLLVQRIRDLMTDFEAGNPEVEILHIYQRRNAQVPPGERAPITSVGLTLQFVDTNEE